MSDPLHLDPPAPVLTADLFPDLLDGLLDLLRSLSPEDWSRPTACAGWDAKDVALHLLGGEIGNLSRRRDGHVIRAEIGSWEELVAYLNGWNQGWVEAARRISPRLLVDLLELTGRQMNDYFAALDLDAMGGSVSWAGPDPASVWLDVAREYTERWHHQQHIRDAVGRPGLNEPRFMAPALAAFVRAMPHTYRDTPAPDGAAVTLTLTGPAGGRWSVVREGGQWGLVAGAPARPDAEVSLDGDIAWRLFTRGLDPDAARAHLRIDGDRPLGLVVLEMVSIIA